MDLDERAQLGSRLITLHLRCKMFYFWSFQQNPSACVRRAYLCIIQKHLLIWKRFFLKKKSHPNHPRAMRKLNPETSLPFVANCHPFLKFCIWFCWRNFWALSLARRIKPLLKHVYGSLDDVTLNKGSARWLHSTPRFNDELRHRHGNRITCLRRRFEITHMFTPQLWAVVNNYWKSTVNDGSIRINSDFWHFLHVYMTILSTKPPAQGILSWWEEM